MSGEGPKGKRSIEGVSHFISLLTLTYYIFSLVLSIFFHTLLSSCRVPDSVKTFKDLKPGIKKAWGALTRRRSSSATRSSSSATSDNSTEQQPGLSDTGGSNPSSESKVAPENQQPQPQASASASTLTSTTATPSSSSPSSSAAASRTSTRSSFRAYSASESDISSIHEEDENEGGEEEEGEKPAVASTSASALTSKSQSQSQFQPAEAEQGGHANANGTEASTLALPKTGLTPHQAAPRLRGDSISDTSSESGLSESALSETETDLDSREATENSIQALSSSPTSYRHQHHVQNEDATGLQHVHGLQMNMERDGTRSGEATPRRRHSPPGTPSQQHHHQYGADKTQQQQMQHQYPAHWVPHLSEDGHHSHSHQIHHPHAYHTHNYADGGTTSQPGSGNNTPRRRLSLSDADASIAHRKHLQNTSSAVFGFDPLDENQLRSRLLDQMDLNSSSRRRRQQPEHEEDDDHDDKEEEDEDEEDVPVPANSMQVRGAGLEMAV